ncbi:hypothetical protein SEA_BING_81 [Streptomyces phage Bing]|uniref:Uncharacterized protein n=1 Tax=Streptomyces phage Bing TaxID=2079427 RepID=A0A2L1IWL5_9CAUD|nr:hypothetical protein FDJ31_gp81 [Streptomyces phage Bing]AVD99503.1 hypothetical protein SEA_BING_81 [Streptomyces phage Bing]
MTNEPIFQKLAAEYAASGKPYERMTAPYLSPVRPLGAAKQPLMDTPVYGPNEHLDGPYKAPLPKRNLAHLIQIPEPDPAITKHFQEFISTAPLEILQGTPAGSFIRNMQPVRTEDGGIALEAEVAIPVGDQREREKEMVPPIVRALGQKAEQMKGVVPQLAIVDELQRFQATGLVDPITQYEIDEEAVRSVPEPISYDEVVELVNKHQGVVLTKTITVAELIDGRTSADIIQELGQEFAENYPTAAVAEVNVGEKLNGDMVVTVRGTLISEEDTTSNTTNPEQTDESVNAASTEETDEDDEPVILAPNFWKIRDEE